MGRGGRSRRVNRDLTTGSIPRNLWGLAWPQVVEGAMRVAQQIMDLFWAGFLGTGSIAGVGVAQQWVQLVWTGRQGVDTSTRAMVSRAVGSGNIPLANHVVFQGLTISIVFLGIISLVGLLFTEALLRFLGVSDTVIGNAAPYMRIQFMGQGILGLQMYAGNSLAAAGDTVTPMRSTVVSRVLQMATSPFLVFGLVGFPEMGLAGLSLASSLANIAGLVINVRALLTGSSRLQLRLSDYRLDGRMMWQMVKVGGPSAVTGAERSIAQLILVGLVAPFGDSALAAYTLTRRMEMFVNLGSQGLGQASGIIVGQSLGAGKQSRARQTVIWATGYVLGIKGLVTLFVFAFPTLVLGIFAHDADLLALASMWVRIQAVGYLALGVSQVAMQSFQTAGDTLVPMIVTLASIWGVQQPLALWFAGAVGPRAARDRVGDHHRGDGASAVLHPVLHLGAVDVQAPLGRLQPPTGGAPASTPPATPEAAAVAQPVVASAGADGGRSLRLVATHSRPARHPWESDVTASDNLQITIGYSRAASNRGPRWRYPRERTPAGNDTNTAGSRRRRPRRTGPLRRP
jgi:putative MATE family efflux protein